MQEELFEQIKEVLGENERLFSKLHKVGQQYEAIDFDESGLYEEEEQTVIGRWYKLSKKITLALNETLEEINVSTIKEELPEKYKITFQFKAEAEEEDTFLLNIDYSKEGEIAIVKEA